MKDTILRILTVSRGAIRDAAAAAALLVTTVVLYCGILGLFWLYDDPFHLRFVLEYRPSQYLLEPAVAAQAAMAVYPAVFMLSHDLDLALFGFDPRGHYAHQLASVAACVLGLYVVSRLWLPRWAAATAALLFLLGPPVVAAAPLLMARHYFEALLLSALAAFCFVLAVRRGGAAWATASAFLYLAATLEMVIALPLPALLAILPEGTPRRRLRLLIGHAVALTAYLGYRMWLLGPRWSSYGWAVRPGQRLELVIALPRKLAWELVGEPSAAAAALMVVLLTAVAMFSWRGLGRLAAALVAAAAPVLPVSTEMEPRYALAAWMVLSTALAFGSARLAERGRRWRGLAVGLTAVALLAGALAARGAFHRHYSLLDQMSIENRFFVAMGARDVIRHPASSAATLEELARLRARQFGIAAGGTWYRDDLHLCLEGGDKERIWGYESVARMMRDVTLETRAAIGATCSAVRWDAPLTARFYWRANGLFWELGPYASGDYAMVVGEGTERIPVPRRGGYQWPTDELTLRVRYADREGWITYSPALRLTRAERELRWQRP